MSGYANLLDNSVVKYTTMAKQKTLVHVNECL